MSTNKNISQTNMIKYKHKNGNLLFKLGKDRFKRALRNSGNPSPAFTKVIKNNKKIPLPPNFWKVYNRKTNRWISTDICNRLQGRYAKKYTIDGSWVVEKAISIDDWGKEGNRFFKKQSDRPFSLTCKSATIENLEQIFDFTNSFHYNNWFKRIKEEIDYQASSNVAVFVQGNGGDRHGGCALVNSVLEFNWLQGGCCREEKIRKIVGSFYEFTLTNPKSQRNNCGLECIRLSGTNMPSNYQIRKQFNIKQGIMLSPDQLANIYATFDTSNRPLVFIDRNYDESIDVRQNLDYTYIMKMAKNTAGEHHYCYVSKMKAIKIKSRRQRGVLAFDFEDRYLKDSDVSNDEMAYTWVGKTKSYFRRDTICKIEYRQNRSKTILKKSFTTVVGGKTSARQFLDWLKEEKIANRRYICVAHNGARFDFFYLIKELTRQEQLHCPPQLRGTSVISMTFHEHVFKDTACFMPNSLDNLCKSFQIEKPKLKEFTYNGKKLSNMELCFYKPELSFKEFMALQQREPKFWSLYETYCESDVVSLLELWTKFNNEMTSLVKEVRPALAKTCTINSASTIGGFAMSLLRNLRKTDNLHIMAKYKQFMFKDNFVRNAEDDDNVDTKKYDFICHFKIGGVSHCHQKGKHCEKVVSFDICSQYPAALMHMIVPSGKSSWVKEFDSKKHGYYLLTNVRFDESIKNGFRPIKPEQAGTLQWDTKHVLDKVYMDSEMIKYLVKRNKMTFEVEKGLVSDHYIDGKMLFGDYVTPMFNAKKEQDHLKKLDEKLKCALTLKRWFRYGCPRNFMMHKHFLSSKYNKALREVIKLCLNAVTGKLIEDYMKYFKVQYTQNEVKKKQNINNLNYTKVKEGKKYNIWINAGVMVYSYSKRLLFEYIDCLPQRSDDVIHVETDGIYFPKPCEEHFKKEVLSYHGDYPIAFGDDLGNIKAEHESEGASYFLRKKFYYMNCPVTDKKNPEIMACKGIRPTTLNEDGSTRILVDRKLYEDVYSNKSVKREYQTLVRTLHSKAPISGHMATRTINPHPDGYDEYPLK